MATYEPYNESLQKWLDKAAKHDILTREQEVELGAKIRAGDQEARNFLVEHNVRLAVSIAKRYRNKGLPFEDLIQEGIIGLHHAARKFDERKGFKFSTYATYWVIQSVQRAIYNHAPQIRVPMHVISERFAVLAYQREHRSATAADISEALSIPLQRVERAIQAAEVVASLDREMNYGDDFSQTLMDVLEDPNAVDPSEMSIEADTPLYDALAQLPEDQRKVIEYRFGLTGLGVMSFKDIAAAMGIGSHRARALQHEALEALGSLLGDGATLPAENEIGGPDPGTTHGLRPPPRARSDGSPSLSPRRKA